MKCQISKAAFICIIYWEFTVGFVAGSDIRYSTKIKYSDNSQKIFNYRTVGNSCSS